MLLSEPMPKTKGSKSGSEPNREPFVTIDDLIKQAQQLSSGLTRLGKYKYPLDIRKGVSAIVTESERSRTVKAGSRTFFFDLKETQEGVTYLTITESRFKGEDGERERATLVVFPEVAAEFSKAVSEMSEQLD